MPRSIPSSPAAEPAATIVSETLAAADSEPIVLQPLSLMGQESGFLADRLEAALMGSRGIIVDLLWIENLTREALKPIVPVFLKARQQGVSITLLSMPHEARSMFEQMLHQSRTPETEVGYSVFSPEFEAFLDHHQNTVKETTLPD